MKAVKRIGISSGLAALLVVGIGCSSKQEAAADKAVAYDDAHAPRMVPGAIAANEITVVSTVTAVDPAQRTVTLRNPAGETHVYKCGPDVRNFDQLRVGDRVNATVVEEMAVFVRP